MVKIGVLTDMSGLYSDIGGPGSVAAAKLAVEDFDPAAHGMKVEVIAGDHQNKPDIGANLARQWYDVDHVDVIVDVPTSSVALAISEITREKNKVFLASGLRVPTSPGRNARRTPSSGPMTPGCWRQHRQGGRSNRW